MLTKAGSSESVINIQGDAYSEQLAQTYHAVKDKISVLSLDCFDTLIWRHVNKPADVFYQLQTDPLMKKYEFSAQRRINGEHVARVKNYLVAGTKEVAFSDIYKAAFPGYVEAKLEAMIEQELKYEEALCYAYSPVVELLKQAHMDGKKCIVVSDTYLSSEQLYQLLEKKLPADVIQCIDKVYVSNESAISKSEGLITKVLQEHNVQPEQVLHIGDNYKADFEKPRQERILSVLYKPQCQHIDEIMRMSEVVASIFFPNVRDSKPYFDQYKTIFSKQMRDNDNSAKKIGYAVLGPIYYQFAKYIHAEYQKIKKENVNVKVAFLLRDARLAFSSCKALLGEELGKEVRISRFTSYAASFRREEDIINYLTTVISGGRYKDMMKQLLLNENEIFQILGKLQESRKPMDTFRELILNIDMVEKIVQRSKKYFANFKKYLVNILNLKAGETLLLVDLGYSCTTQMTLGPVIKEELGVNVLGRYLISIKTRYDYKDRRGLIDQSWCQEYAMLAVVNYIALLEQLSTTTDQSVVGFDESGNPIYSDSKFNENQYEKVESIQAHCLSFISDMKQNISSFKFDQEYIREFVLIWLARFIFLPTKVEMAYLSDLKFDLNLGTTDTFSVFNPEVGIDLLRERGLFSIEKSTSLMRTNYPSELRYAGIEQAIMLMAQHRFAFNFSLTDTTLRHENIEVIFTKGSNSAIKELSARATYDGFFTMDIPIGFGGVHIGLVVGNKYKWVQIGSVSVIDVDKLYTDAESTGKAVVEDMQCDKVQEHGGGLLECLDQNALCIFSVPNLEQSSRYVLRFNFRPITHR